MDKQERILLEKYLDDINELLDKVPNSRIEGSTEYKIKSILEQVNDQLEITYLGKYL